jgi:pyridoxamine 5'-phosphate oxidase
VPLADPIRREYFAVINAQVLAIDWLELHLDGHRRAVFDEHGARWVQP